MGILNAIFAPFIVLYLLMYSFFRYFDVSLLSIFSLRIRTSHLLTGIPQKPFFHRWQTVHSLCSVEIQRVQ